MRRNNRNTVYLNQLISLSLKGVREVGLFGGDGYQSLPVVLSSWNGETVKMNLTVSRQQGNSYVEFDYIADGEEINYRVQLVQVNSTIGGVNYFLCPFSNHRCRRLYLHDKFFMGRVAIKNGYYFRDTLSKNQRMEFGTMHKIETLEQTISLLKRKHYMSRYASKHTKKHIRVMQAQKELDRLAA